MVRVAEGGSKTSVMAPRVAEGGARGGCGGDRRNTAGRCSLDGSEHDNCTVHNLEYGFVYFFHFQHVRIFKLWTSSLLTISRVGSRGVTSFMTLSCVATFWVSFTVSCCHPFLAWNCRWRILHGVKRQLIEVADSTLIHTRAWNRC